MSIANVPLPSELWLPRGISSTSRSEYLMYALPAAMMDLDTITNETSNYDTGYISPRARSRFEYLASVWSALPAATNHATTTVESSNHNADSCHKSLRTRAPGEKQSEDDCPICLDDMNQETVAILDCQHEYHEKCISKWLVNKDSCPKCRAQV